MRHRCVKVDGISGVEHVLLGGDSHFRFAAQHRQKLDARTVVEARLARRQNLKFGIVGIQFPL
jgi:hypothetical protein